VGGYRDDEGHCDVVTPLGVSIIVDRNRHVGLKEGMRLL
jgi:hypothetical protein